ncbi:MAG: DUF58 domain-containing protein [Desulfobacteraceae bacterium]|jgi:uncharacterized protein (DUF58 family)
MLSPEIIKKIKRIHFKSGRTVNSLMAGQYRSVFRGAGIEFEEVREYSPGDDVKSIDWKVSARLGKPYVKRFREERELIVMLLVDLSASGRFGTDQSTKQETAAEVAAVLAFNAIRNNDKVGAILFTDQVEKYIPPKKGSGHVWRVIKEIFTFVPEGVGTDLEGAVAYLGRVCSKRTVSFLISDFLNPKIGGDVPRKLKSAGRRHELIGVLISDPGEFKLPAAGILQLEDLETHTQMVLDASDPATRKRYETYRKEDYQQIRSRLKAIDMDCVEMSTCGDAAETLSRYFRLRERRKR